MSLSSKPSDLIRFTDPTIGQAQAPLIKAEQLINAFVAKCPLEVIHKVTDELIQPYRLQVQDNNRKPNQAPKYSFYGFPASREIDALLGVSELFSQAVEDTIKRRFTGLLDINRNANTFVQQLSKSFDLSWLIERVSKIVVCRQVWDDEYSISPSRMIRFSTFPKVKTIYMVNHNDDYLYCDQTATTDEELDEFTAAEVKRLVENKNTEGKMLQKERRMAREMGAEMIFGSINAHRNAKLSWSEVSVLGPLPVAVVHKKYTEGSWQDLL